MNCVVPTITSKVRRPHGRGVEHGADRIHDAVADIACRQALHRGDNFVADHHDRVGIRAADVDAEAGPRLHCCLAQGELLAI
jgi:hypothetical protein